MSLCRSLSISKRDLHTDVKGTPKDGYVIDTDVPLQSLYIQLFVATSSTHAWPAYQANLYRRFEVYHQH